MHRLTALLLALAVLAPAPLAATAVDGLGVSHSFPEAGATLHVVWQGLVPANPVVITLADLAWAPPSVVEALRTGFEPVPDPSGITLDVLATADERGMVVLAVDLDDPGDAGRALDLSLEEAGTRRSASVHLVVQPPLLLLPTFDGIARVDLRDGTVLQPPLSNVGGLKGAALSVDGTSSYVLREDGVLEERATTRWGDRPVRRYVLDPDSDDLAHSPRSGPAFVIVRPEGLPFAAHGRVDFLDEGLEAVLVEPMGGEVSGRRWAISDDGLTAFVAEDDLLVREIDLMSGTKRDLFTAGTPGDRTIADVAFAGSRLLVLTRRPDGRAGSVTVFDLGNGRLSLQPLDVDPLRLVVLDDETALVVPASGGEAPVLVAGVPVDRLLVDGRVVDATATPAGAALLVEEAAGHALHVWQPSAGVLGRLGPVPAARRLVGAGHPVGVLVGAEDGRVHRVDLVDGSVSPLLDGPLGSDVALVTLP